MGERDTWVDNDSVTRYLRRQQPQDPVQINRLLNNKINTQNFTNH